MDEFEPDACAAAVLDAVHGFTADGVDVIDARIEYRHNSHDEESMFVIIQLDEPQNGVAWPADSIYDLRFVITDAAVSTDCDIPIYMQIEVAETLPVPSSI